jgi:DNA-damage-inducible protein J
MAKLLKIVYNGDERKVHNLNTTIVQSHVSGDIKEEAEALFRGLGLDLPTAIRIFLTVSVQRRGFPFEVAEEIPNEETQQAMRECLEGRNMSGPYDSVDEMMRDLTEGLCA